MGALQYILFVFLLNGISLSKSQLSSGSGSGSDPCADITCYGGGTCMEEHGVAYCSCPNGSAVYDVEYTCEACAVGYWGMNCKMTCADNCGGEGRVSSCHAVTGQCECNKCWTGDNCEMESAGNEGYECVLEYLESIDKNLDNFGGTVPRAHDNHLLGLAEELVDDSGTIVQDGSTTMTVVDRDEVDARPLLRFSFILREGPGSTDYDNAVSSLKDKVKTGEIRGTLIIDESDGDSGTVTLNA